MCVEKLQQLKIKRVLYMNKVVFRLLMFISFAFSFFACALTPDGKTSIGYPRIETIQLSAQNTLSSQEMRIAANLSKGLVYDSDGLYRLYGDQIVYIPTDGVENKVMQIDVPDGRNVENGLAKNTDKLYIITNNAPASNETVFTGDRKTLHTLDLAGNSLNTYDLMGLGDHNSRIEDFVIIGEAAFILVNRYSNASGVYAFEMENGVMTKLDFNQADSITAMDGKLLICNQIDGGFTSEISVYNIVSGQTEMVYTIRKSPISSMVYDNESSVLHGMCNNELFSFTFTDSSYTFLYQFPDASLFSFDRIAAIALHQNKICVVQGDGNIKTVSNPHGDWSGGKTLVVRCFGRFDAAQWTAEKTYAAFLEENPLFRLEYVEALDWDSYQTNTIKKLMANDTDFDLFTINENMPNVIEKGYYEDLMPYVGVARNFDNMLPGLRALFSHNGKIIGVPVSLRLDGYTYTPASLATYNIKNPEPMLTIQDYRRLFDEASMPFAIGSITFLDMYANLASAFAEGRDIKQSDVTTFYEDMLAIHKAGGLAGITGDMQGLFQSVFLNEYSGTLPHVSVPAYKENTGVAVAYTALVINPNSKNKELAAAYLAMLTSPDMENAFLDEYIPLLDSIYGHSHEGEEPDEAHKAADLRYMEEQAGYLYLYEREAMRDNEAYQLYTSVLAQSVRRYANSSLYMFARETFERLTRDEVTADKAGELVYKKMLLMRDE